MATWPDRQEAPWRAGRLFACRDIRPGRNDRGGISMVSAERAKPETVS